MAAVGPWQRILDLVEGKGPLLAQQQRDMVKFLIPHVYRFENVNGLENAAAALEWHSAPPPPSLAN